MDNPFDKPAKTVLIVEDEVILLEVLRDRLQEDGWNVKMVQNGKEAIDFLFKTPVDLVLLDLLLPQKSGFEVLETIKADSELKNIPVIVLSNLGGDEDIKRALSLGADDYFVKTQHPIGEVLDKIKKYKE